MTRITLLKKIPFRNCSGLVLRVMWKCVFERPDHFGIALKMTPENSETGIYFYSAVDEVTKLLLNTLHIHSSTCSGC